MVLSFVFTVPGASKVYSPVSVFTVALIDLYRAASSLIPWSCSFLNSSSVLVFFCDSVVIREISV